MGDSSKRFGANNLKEFITELYMKGGMNASDAAFHALGLVEASLRGVDSHGVMRTGAYFERLISGAINAAPNYTKVAGDKALCVIDADAASGYSAAKYAMEQAIALAGEYNAGIVHVRNSNHFGAAALYAQMAVDAGMVGLATTNVKPLITAPGAAGNVTGNNPFALGIPTYSDFPFMLDMALSVVAGGKLKMAASKGEKIPLDWATDIDGNPTDDPVKGFDGYLLPMGGFKGLGLAHAIDILCGLVTGGAFQNHIKSMYKDPKDPSRTCHILMAVNLSAIIGPEMIRERMAEYRQALQSVPTASGSPLCLPGEPEEATRRERMASGIPLPPAIVDELRGYAERYSLPNFAD